MARFTFALLLSATLASAIPSPFARALAQASGEGECLIACLGEYTLSDSGAACIGNADLTNLSDPEANKIFACWCNDASTAGKGVDSCAAECTDGSAEMWEATCEEVNKISPIDEEEVTTTINTSRPTTTAEEEEEETTTTEAPTEEETLPAEPTDDAEETPLTTTRIRPTTKPTTTAPPEYPGAANQYLPHAGALAAGLMAAVIAL